MNHNNLINKERLVYNGYNLSDVISSLFNGPNNFLNNPFEEENRWSTPPPHSLLEHIVGLHLSPGLMRMWGIARYDIEKCKELSIPVVWMVERIYEKLEKPDSDIQAEIDKARLHGKFTFDDYRATLVKNLIYIEQLGLAYVDWFRVRKAFKDAFSIQLDLRRDDRDPSTIENSITIEH